VSTPIESLAEWGSNLGSMQPRSSTRSLLFSPYEGETPVVLPKEVLKGLEEVKDDEKLKRIDFVLRGSFP